MKMDKQHSVEFFSSFVDSLQDLCRTFLDFDQIVEVSGYMCVEIDNSKKERYVLSEMVNTGGNVISESYCTKVFRTMAGLNKPNMFRTTVNSNPSRTRKKVRKKFTKSIEQEKENDFSTSSEDSSVCLSVSEDSDVGKSNPRKKKRKRLKLSRSGNGGNRSENQQTATSKKSISHELRPRSSSPPSDGMQPSNSETRSWDKSNPGGYPRQQSQEESRADISLPAESNQMNSFFVQHQEINMPHLGEISEEQKCSNSFIEIKLEDDEPAKSNYHGTSSFGNIEEISSSAAVNLGHRPSDHNRGSGYKSDAGSCGYVSQHLIPTSYPSSNILSNEQPSQDQTFINSFLQPGCSTGFSLNLCDPHGKSVQSEKDTVDLLQGFSKKICQGSTSTTGMDGAGRSQSSRISQSSDSLPVDDTEDVIDLDLEEIEDDEDLCALTCTFATPGSSSFPVPGLLVPNTAVSESILSSKSPFGDKSRRYAVKLFKDFQKQRGIFQPVHTIPPDKLDALVGDFLVGLKKSNGDEFEPSSIKSIHSYLDRHLKDNNYPYSITKDPLFENSRERFRAKKKQLMEMGKGKGIQKSSCITDEDIEILFQKDQLGGSCPDSLINTMWFLNNVYFGVKGLVENYNMKWGDVVLDTDHKGREFLSYIGTKSVMRQSAPRMYSKPNNPARCYVNFYKQYRDARPLETLHPDSAFYLTVNRFQTHTGVTFKPENTGWNRLSMVMKTMVIGAGFSPDKKLTNSSAYKRLVQTSKEK